MLLLLGDFLFDGGVLFPSNLAKRDAFGKSESLLEVSRERRIIVLSQQVLHIRHAHDSREQLCHGWRRGSGFLEASNTLPAMAEAIATSEHNLCLELLELLPRRAGLGSRVLALKVKQA